MKGKELITEIIRSEVPDIDKTLETIKSIAELQTTQKKSPNKRLLAAKIAVAAVICLALSGGIYLFIERNLSSHGNSLHEWNNDLFQNTGGTGSINQNESFYIRDIPIVNIQDIEVNDPATPDNFHIGQLVIRDYFIYDNIRREIGLMEHINPTRILYIFLPIQYEGEAVESVEFSVDKDGFFMKASIPTEDGIPPQLKRREDMEIPTSARQHLGSSFIIYDISEITEDSMLFVGREMLIGTPIELNLTVSVIVTFTSGSKQEIVFTVE